MRWTHGSHLKGREGGGERRACLGWASMTLRGPVRRNPRRVSVSSCLFWGDCSYVPLFCVRWSWRFRNPEIANGPTSCLLIVCECMTMCEWMHAASGRYASPQRPQPRKAKNERRSWFPVLLVLAHPCWPSVQCPLEAETTGAAVFCVSAGPTSDLWLCSRRT
jgi:hypothetical protein